MITLIQNLNVVGFLYTCSFYFLLENYQVIGVLDNYLSVDKLLLLSICLNMLGFFIEKSNMFTVFLNILWGNVGFKLLFSSGEEISNLLGKFIRSRASGEKKMKLAEWLKEDKYIITAGEELELLNKSINYDDLYTNYLALKESKAAKINLTENSNMLYGMFSNIYNFAADHYILTVLVFSIGIAYCLYTNNMFDSVVKASGAQRDYINTNSKLGEVLCDNTKLLKNQVVELNNSVLLLNEKDALIVEQLKESNELLFNKISKLNSNLVNLQELNSTYESFFRILRPLLETDVESVYRAAKLFSNLEDFQVDWLVDYIMEECPDSGIREKVKPSFIRFQGVGRVLGSSNEAIKKNDSVSDLNLD